MKEKPKHVGIIMDGNGRWARQRNLPRTVGHQRGLETLREVIEAAIRLGIVTLYVYAFSSENWKRPAEEVGFLMRLAESYFRNEIRQLHEQGVKLRFIGGRDELTVSLFQIIQEAEELTKDNTKLTLVIAFNYGGHGEITRMVRRIAAQVANNVLDTTNITETVVSEHLDTAGIPFPDLIIRTGGEVRLSNFLLWQAAYAELLFLNILWPDFATTDLVAAIEEYKQRDRRLGGLSSS